MSDDQFNFDHYTLLGIDRKATPEFISDATKFMRAAFQPDRFIGKHKAMAEAHFKLVEEAIDVLTTPRKKARFDEWWDAAHQDVQAQAAVFPYGGPHCQDSEIAVNKRVSVRLPGSAGERR